MLILFLILIFIRPFISSLAFPYLNTIYASSLFCFLLIWVLLKGLPLENIKQLKYPLIIFIIALAISSIFSYNRLASAKELYKYAGGLLIFMFCTTLSAGQRNRVIQGIILAGFLISILAIHQYFFGFSHLLNYINKQGITDAFALDYIERRRVFFPFVTPNTLAGYLIMILPLSAGYSGAKKGIFSKIQPIILACVFFSLLLTKSLGALISLFFSFSIYFYAAGKLTKRKLLLLLGLSIAIIAIFILRTTIQKAHSTVEFSSLMRLTYWKGALGIIKLKFFTGSGLGNFNLPYARYAHNTYLQIFAETGILGILAFLWFIYKLLKTGFLRLSRNNQDFLLFGLLLSNLAFLLHNLVDFTFFLPEVSLTWWLLAGILFSLPQLS